MAIVFFAGEKLSGTISSPMIDQPWQINKLVSKPGFAINTKPSHLTATHQSRHNSKQLLKLQHQYSILFPALETLAALIFSDSL